MTGKPAEPSKEAVELLARLVTAVRAAGWDSLAKFLFDRSVGAVMLPVLFAALQAERERTLRRPYDLAMYVLQSDLYQRDADVGDAVDDVLAAHRALSAPPPEGGKA